MSPGENAWCILLLEATTFTYLLIVRDQRVEWEQQQKGENHFNQWCVPMCAARVDIICNPRYSGEYKLNYISLFNFPILRRIWSYITEEVPRAGEDRGVINPVDDHHPSVKLK